MSNFKIVDLVEMIAVIQAHKEGKGVQVNHIDGNGWLDQENPSWNFKDCDYRIKPEPKVIWVNEFADGSSGGCNYSSKQKARQSAMSGLLRTVKYIEVIDE